MQCSNLPYLHRTKRLLIIAYVGLLTCKASVQTTIGITKQSLKESKGFIKVINDSVEHIQKPYNALQFKGEYASYVGIVSRVIVIKPGYALLTLVSDRTQSKVFMFTKASRSRAMRYKGRLVGIKGNLDVHDSSPVFREYGTSDGLIYPLRIADSGCKCFKDEPTNAIVIDTTKVQHH